MIQNTSGALKLARADLGSDNGSFSTSDRMLTTPLQPHPAHFATGLNARSARPSQEARRSSCRLMAI
jgi:hypothetical protein